MWSHEPAGYDCPFCRVATGGETDLNRRGDVVWRDELTTAFISPRWWDSNPAHVIVVPNEHFENLYVVPEPAIAAVYATAKRLAAALMAEYSCDGTSTRQHNGPGAGQEVWHLHVHVFPRYAGDELYENNKRVRWTQPEERAPYARRLRERLRIRD